MFYSTKDAAKLIGVSYATLQSQIFNGKLPAPSMKIGSHHLFSDDEIAHARKHFATRKAQAKGKQKQ